jgi:tRNA(Ile)-lysidine synthase
MIRARVFEWVERYALLPLGSKIVVACSGGPDSLALVDLLDGFRQDRGLILHIAHFDHGLRGEESRGDAEFVRLFCAARGLPFFCGNGDVQQEVRRGGGSIEEVARRLRYEYLRRVAGEVGAELIATGHHRDDQAETILLNLVRGSGGRGLGAMRPRQGDVVRPLLCLTRIEIETYCQERQLNPRIDNSNTDVEFRRNRVRHELTPLLRQRFNPGLTDALCRTAEILSDEQDFLQGYVEERLSEMAVRCENGFRLKASAFSHLHVAVQRVLVLKLLEKLRGETRGITFSHVEQIRDLFVQDRGSQRMDLPGEWQARKCYQDLFLEHPQPPSVPKAAHCLAGIEQRLSLTCPGETFLPEFGVSIRCARYSGERPPFKDLGVTKAVFECADLQMPLFVRKRHPGDIFQSLGAAGARKLKKVLIDLKIPVEMRDRVPLVCDDAGILWVVGFRRAERGRMSADTTDYIVLEVIPCENTHLWEETKLC